MLKIRFEGAQLYNKVTGGKIPFEDYYAREQEGECSFKIYWNPEVLT